jgi:hypothetical protein
VNLNGFQAFELRFSQRYNIKRDKKTDMKSEEISYEKGESKQVTAIFERIRRIDENGNEYWSARDFSKVLEYVDYRNFISVINRAKEACKNSKHIVTDRFVEINEMVQLGSGAETQTVNRTSYAK